MQGGAKRKPEDELPEEVEARRTRSTEGGDGLLKQVHQLIRMRMEKSA